MHYSYILFAGHGNEKGGIVTKIFNEGQKPLKIVYLDIIPWFLRVYLHTLKVTKSHQYIRFFPKFSLNFKFGSPKNNWFSIKRHLIEKYF